MKHNRLVMILIVSLIFNGAFLAGLGYRLWERQRVKTQMIKSSCKPSKGDSGLSWSPEMREKLKQIREASAPRISDLKRRLAEERESLVQLLMKENPDSLEVDDQLRAIVEFQVDADRILIHHMLGEKDALPLDERRVFLETMLKRHRHSRSSSKRRSRSSELKSTDVPHK